MGMDTSKLCYGCFGEHNGVGPCPRCGFDIATAKHPAIALPIGTILNGRYLTGRVLGVGGFGVTYLAMDMTLETPVAVKEYLPSGIAIRDNDHYTMTVSSQDEQAQFDSGATKFLDEARILAKLRKIPNIVTVHDFFRENGTAYFVMEYIDGVDLMRYTASKGGKLSFEETRDLLLPVMKSLAVVHDNDLLHRDISPDNILVTKTGTTHLLDFGAARLSVDSVKSRSIILKHGFAPEEQYRKHGNQGPWSDEYALAATMYLVITGVMPPDAIERVHEDTLKSPADLGIAIPDYANAALMKALSVQASGRFPDMKSFADAITGKATAPSIAVPPIAAAASSAASATSAPAFSTGFSSTGNTGVDYSSISTVSVNEEPAPAAVPSSTGSSAFQPVSQTSQTSAAPSVGSPALPSPFKPAGSSSVGTSGGYTSSPAPVTESKPQKTSIWKKPLTWVIIAILAVGAVAAPVTYFALNKKSSEETEETTKKRTKKTTEETDDTTEEPSTTTTTEEPTTTTTTSAPTTLSPLDMKEYRIGTYSYKVSSKWFHTESNGYQYFFKDLNDAETFMMVYERNLMDPGQLSSYGYDKAFDELNQSLLKEFGGGTLVSCEKNDGNDKETWEDIELEVNYQGKKKKMPMHIILDKVTGDIYVFCIFMNADLDSGTIAENMEVYNSSIPTITREDGAPATPTPAQTSDPTGTTASVPSGMVAHTVGSYSYSFSNEWQYLEKSIYQYFFEDQNKMDNFMMIYTQHMMTPDQMKTFGYEATLDEFNKGLIAEFGNGKLESCTKTDGGDKDYYEDIVITGTYQGASKKLPIRVILDKVTGDCYVFCMYMDANLDSATEAKIMELYNSCLSTIQRTN